MREILEKYKNNNVQHKQKKNFNEKGEMINMKKIITIIVSISLAGALITGCGKKDAATQETSTQAVETKKTTVPESVAPDAGDLQAVPSQDVNGNELTKDDAEDFAIMQKNSPIIKEKTTKLIHLLFDMKKETSEEGFKSINALGDSFFPEEMKEIKEAQDKGGYSFTIIEYNIDKIAFEPLKDLQTGEEKFGCKSITTVKYKEKAGEEYTDEVRLYFYPNSSGDWLISDIGISETKK